MKKVDGAFRGKLIDAAGKMMKYLNDQAKIDEMEEQIAIILDMIDDGSTQMPDPIEEKKIKFKDGVENFVQKVQSIRVFKNPSYVPSQKLKETKGALTKLRKTISDPNSVHFILHDIQNVAKIIEDLISDSDHFEAFSVDFREELQKMTTLMNEYSVGNDFKDSKTLEAKLEGILTIMQDIEESDSNPTSSKDYIMEKFLSSQSTEDIDQGQLPNTTEPDKDKLEPFSIGELVVIENKSKTPKELQQELRNSQKEWENEIGRIKQKIIDDDDLMIRASTIERQYTENTRSLNTPGPSNTPNTRSMSKKVSFSSLPAVTKNKLQKQEKSTFPNKKALTESSLPVRVSQQITNSIINESALAMNPSAEAPPGTSGIQHHTEEGSTTSSKKSKKVLKSISKRSNSVKTKSSKKNQVVKTVENEIETEPTWQQQIDRALQSNQNEAAETKSLLSKCTTIENEIQNLTLLINNTNEKVNLIFENISKSTNKTFDEITDDKNVLPALLPAEGKLPSISKMTNMSSGLITGYVVRRSNKQMVIESLSDLEVGDFIIGAIKNSNQAAFDTHPEIKETHLKNSAISPAKVTGLATRSIKKGKTAWASGKNEMKRGHAIAGVATRTELSNGKSVSGWLPILQKIPKQGKRKKVKNNEDIDSSDTESKHKKLRPKSLI